jgi:hypothetical protein
MNTGIVMMIMTKLKVMMMMMMLMMMIMIMMIIMSKDEVGREVSAAGAYLSCSSYSAL